MSGSGISLSLQLGCGRAATSSGRLSSSGPAAFNNQISLDFDGLDDYVETNSNFQSTFQSNYTFSFWCKLDNTSSTQFFLSANNGPSTDRVACFLSGGRIALFGTSNGKGTASIFDTSGTTLSNWFHVVGRFEQSGSSVIKSLYVNGFKRATATQSPMTLSEYGTVNSPVEVYVGARNLNGSSGFFTNGLIDEVAIFPSALSDGGVSAGNSAANSAGGQVATLYNGGVPGDISSLNPVAWFRMGDSDGGSGDTITNAAPASSSNNINASIINGTQGNTTPTYSSSVPS